MTSPATLAAGLRAHAQGLRCLEAAAELLIALGSSLPCSRGEQRMLKITASLADGIPVDLQNTSPASTTTTSQG